MEITKCMNRLEVAVLTKCYTQHSPRPVTILKLITKDIYFIQIPFINKEIDFIDLPSLFHGKSVTSSVPDYFQNSEPPIICYKYNQPIRNLIMYNEHVSDRYIDANTPDSRECKDSKGGRVLSPFFWPP